MPPDPETLRADRASSPAGAAFAIGDAGELDQVYEQLGSRIGTRTEKREISVGFAAGGLLLLLGGLGTGLRWRGRIV